MDTKNADFLDTRIANEFKDLPPEKQAQVTAYILGMLAGIQSSSSQDTQQSA